MFHLVSLSLQISLTDLPGPCLGLCVGVACFVVCLGGFVVGFFLTGKFDLNHMLIPVVDRPCLALVRQCRKKRLSIFVANSLLLICLTSRNCSIFQPMIQHCLPLRTVDMRALGVAT